MLHLAKSSTVSVRFQPEILNGNLSILYVVSLFTIIINLSQLSSIIHNYHQFIHPQLSSTDTLQSSRLYVVSRTFTIIFMKRQCLRQYLHEKMMFTMLRRCFLTTYLFIATTLPTPPPPRKQCGSGICCDLRF